MLKIWTLGNALTGDQPRDYNYDVVRRPAQMVNVEDLATSVNIFWRYLYLCTFYFSEWCCSNSNRGILKSTIRV